MFQSHYDVGGHKFANIFQAFDHSIKTGQFCYYKIDQNWIDAVQSVKINQQPTRETLKDLYCRKLKTLRNTYKKLVLAYTGGTDSHTILDIAIKNKIYIDEVFIEFSGVMELVKDKFVNQEFITAFDFAQKHLRKDIGNIKVVNWNKQDYDYLNIEDWWKNPTYYQHNKIRVKPCWAVFASKYYKDLDGVVITGHEKPGIRFKNNKFYWYVTDTGTTEHKIIKNAYPFFLDPEIASHYSFALKSSVQNNTNYFTKIDDRHDFFWRIPKSDIKKFYDDLGYTFISEDALEFTQKPAWGTQHNYKNQGVIQYLKNYGHNDILNRLFELHQKIYNQYCDHPYTVQTDGTFVKTVERYSQMFEITDNSLICRGHDI